MWTEKEMEQWEEIREKISELMGREIKKYERITDTILDFIYFYQKMVSK